MAENEINVNIIYGNIDDFPHIVSEYILGLPNKNYLFESLDLYKDGELDGEHEWHFQHKHIAIRSGILSVSTFEDVKNWKYINPFDIKEIIMKNNREILNHEIYRLNESSYYEFIYDDMGTLSVLEHITPIVNIRDFKRFVPGKIRFDDVSELWVFIKGMVNETTIALTDENGCNYFRVYNASYCYRPNEVILKTIKHETKI